MSGSENAFMAESEALRLLALEKRIQESARVDPTGRTSTYIEAVKLENFLTSKREEIRTKIWRDKGKIAEVNKLLPWDEGYQKPGFEDGQLSVINELIDFFKGALIWK